MITPKTEVELSPFVQKYWKDKGFCVHGEVAIYNDGSFVDHVAHLGPCPDPEYIVAIEMKKGANKSLHQQIWSIDRQHVADEIWGVVINPPRNSTLVKWKGEGVPDKFNVMSRLWHNAGLLVWRDGALDKLEDCTVTIRQNHKRYYRKNSNRLLLVPENKDMLGGWPSGGATYITHWSLGLAHIESIAREFGEFATDDIYANLHPCMGMYKNPKSAALRMLNHMVKKGALVSLGKEGRRKKFAIRG